MSHIRYRHIIGKSKCIKPLLVAIEGARSKSFALEADGELVDLQGGSLKCFTRIKKVSIVFKIVDINFKSSFFDEEQSLTVGYISGGRNNLE